ncbi:O-antigen ligase family protein [Alkalimarinus alittae]|uniref:O-antigen ligase family protein n=1 Tax=Alkalimarinus alittae TaxID=2961619 RepID=A0ABY6MX07_9ALTE|nr:O-antigen ligase family protein [Alkalimarinus alittae]UZE94358.1 O-antigen ligase family protein [Alkalimarinus alittae]
MTNINVKHEKASQRSVNQVKPILVYLTCIYVITWYLQLGLRVDILGKIRFEFILGVFLIISAVIHASNSRDKPSPLTPYIYMYIFTLLFSIVFSYDRSHSIDIFVDRVVKFSMLALFISSFIRNTWALKLFLAAFLLACFKMGQEGFLGWYTGSLVWQNQGIMRLHGSTPLYLHPNSFAGMALGTLPFIYFLFPLASKTIKVFFACLTIFSLVIIIFSGSRTAYVGLAVVIFYAIFKTGLSKKYLIIMLFGLSISASFIPDSYIERFESIFTGKEKEGNSSGARLKIIEDAIEIYLSHPLGVGVAAFPKVRTDTFGRTQDTHNLYLEVLTNIGIQGFIIFFLLVYNTIKLNKINIAKTKHLLGKSKLINGNSENTIELKILAATSQALVLFLLIRLTLGLFGMDLYEIYWWLAIGLTISIYRILDNLESSLAEEVTN